MALNATIKGTTDKSTSPISSHGGDFLGRMIQKVKSLEEIFLDNCHFIWIGSVMGKGFSFYENDSNFYFKDQLSFWDFDSYWGKQQDGITIWVPYGCKSPVHLKWHNLLQFPSFSREAYVLGHTCISAWNFPYRLETKSHGLWSTVQEPVWYREVVSFCSSLPGTAWRLHQFLAYFRASKGWVISYIIWKSALCSAVKYSML